jgi:hypothetical protein
MRAFLVTFVLACFLYFEAPATAQTAIPLPESLNTQSDPAYATRIGDTCTFQSVKNEIDDYSNCIFEDSQGNLFVAEDYVKQLKFNSYGLAAVYDDDPARHQFMYVDRRGRAIVQGVTIYDNWAADFSDGLVTIGVNKKYGYANPQGKIVIATKYDGVWPFKRGYAMVCVGCRETCIVSSDGSVDPDCEHRALKGGDWFKINKAGRVVARVPAP